MIYRLIIKGDKPIKDFSSTRKYRAGDTIISKIGKKLRVLKREEVNNFIDGVNVQAILYCEKVKE
jgi:hypothetical protein